MDALINTVRERKEAASAQPRANAKVLLATAALICFVVGFISPILGLIIIVIHTTVPGDHILEQLGTVLMVISILLLLLGSHMMDVFERYTRAQKENGKS